MDSAQRAGGRSRRRLLTPQRLIVYPAAVLIIVAVLAIQLGWVGSNGYRQLRGATDEHQPISVWLEHDGRVHALHTQLIGLCENGGTYQVGWSPDSPRIPFRARHGVVVGRESAVEAGHTGIVVSTTVWTTARTDSGGRTAVGDVRYQAIFRYPDGRRLRCDSGYVHWSVNAAGSATGSDLTGPAGSYSPVSSLAEAATPAQLQFALEVDNTCSFTYNHSQLRQLRIPPTVAAWIGSQRVRIADHERQYVAISRLGLPPAGAGLYRAWLANMHGRIQLEGLALRQLASGQTERSSMTLANVSFLKVQGDSVGQEFGLRVCTSNGPLRQTIGR